jgi:hypothetical protein
MTFRKWAFGLAITVFGFSPFVRAGSAGTIGESRFTTAHERKFVEFGGASLTIAPESSGVATGEGVILERGELRFISGNGYHVKASSLRITAFASQTSGSVRMNPNGEVQIAAVNGAIRVENASGIELARLLPGESLAFQVGANAGNTYDINGCLSAQDGRYFVTEATTNLKIELRGTDLAKYVGQRVRVTGNTSQPAPPAGTARIVDVGQITPLPGEVCGPAGGKVKSGSHHVVRGVVIGGVVVGGTLGGLGAAGVFSDNPVSPSKP